MEHGLVESDDSSFPFQHIRDLERGSNPTDWDNLIPFPQSLRDKLPVLYSQCCVNGLP
ncbi:hypothetical protein [Corallococcus exiguus]|uniref:hypothetical protein n=1 Tax=Corallococcus exiguus TaxID=83462 RepID=UPI001471D0E1|nr:hypothetical protein [Corallococcus exiguus]